MAQNQSKVMMAMLTRQIRPALREIAHAKFEAAKQWLVDAVRAHPVSRDINSHRPSSLLGGSQTGTLFGFLGMESGSDPVEELVDFLENNIIYSESPGRRGLYSATIKFPSKSEMNSDSYLCPHWINVAWPILIEDGASGLAYYLNQFSPNSISEEGIQVKNVVRNADFKGTPFLSPLVAQFRSKLLLK